MKRKRIYRIVRAFITFLCAALITAAVVISMAALAFTDNTMQNMTGNDNKVFAFNPLGESLVQLTVLGASFTIDYQKIYAARDALSGLIQADLNCLPAIAGYGLDSAGKAASDMAGSIAQLPPLISQMMNANSGSGSQNTTQPTTTEPVY